MTHLDLQALAQKVTAGDAAAAATLQDELLPCLRRMARRATRGVEPPAGNLARLLRAEAAAGDCRHQPAARVAERVSRRVVSHLQALGATPLSSRDTVLESCFVG